jgi:3-deoxy-7-phosphoheptulonate synthase
MMIVMKDEATEKEIQHVVEKLESVGAKAHISKGKYKTVIGAIGDREKFVTLPWEAFPGVEKAVPILKPFKLVSREFRSEDSIIKVDNVTVGSDHFTVMAGPCSVETEGQVVSTAKLVKKEGASILRGGAFKPRTSPYSFQGLGVEGLKILAKAREETGLPIVTEVMDARDVEVVGEFADILQIGARNMQNFLLLKEVGLQKKPVLLKRGFSNTIEELLMAAEYIVSSGNPNVILCERGIRTFETFTRNTLDLSAVPSVQSLSHLPIVVDPSHATGKSELIEPLCLAALAAGANGILVEVHPKPEEAWCDGPQSLDFNGFAHMMRQIKSLVSVLEKKLG